MIEISARKSFDDYEEKPSLAEASLNCKMLDYPSESNSWFGLKLGVCYCYCISGGDSWSVFGYAVIPYSVG